MKNNNRTKMKPTMKNKNEKTTIVQQSYNNRSTMKTIKHERNTTMKHDNETRQRKQHINTAMTLSNEKQQPYNNETNNGKQESINNNRTIIQQSFNNEKAIKHTNETRQ